jgi:hypothetical protein
MIPNEPIPAHPLEYQQEESPFIPRMIRALALFAIVFGSIHAITDLRSWMYLIQGQLPLLMRSAPLVNRLGMLLFFLTGIVQIFQIIAGIACLKSPENFRILFTCARLSLVLLAANLLLTIMSIWNFQIPTHWGMAEILNVLRQFAQLGESAMLPILVVIVARHRAVRT